MFPNPVDGQWLDFYALLDVPANAEEGAIRKRIGKVYSEAAANSDHRDLARRHYFQALVERVLPQCRRVLLDPEWRAKYDRQHILNANNDPSAQNYVAFIASMRGKDNSISDEVLPQRLQDDINLAREVVECAWQGTQLELLPSQAVSKRDPLETSPPAPEIEVPFERRARVATTKTLDNNAAENAAPVRNAAPVSMSDVRIEATPVVAPVETAPVASIAEKSSAPVAVEALAAEAARVPVEAPLLAGANTLEGEVLRAQVITAQEAAQIRRRRASNPGGEEGATLGGVSNRISVAPPGRVSRVVIGESAPRPRARLISSTSMNLMVAIVGVLLTITVQQFAGTPAVATNVGRTPIFVAVAPEMEAALQNAESGWEKTPDGASFDLVVQNVGSREGLRRALGGGEAVPDIWIPSDASWVENYNRKASHLGRETIASDEFIAQSPMVLIARSSRAGELRRAFPHHQIASWNALRASIASGAVGHLGLADPQKTESGALSRFSMAREWGASRGFSPLAASKRADFWKWMAGFENNAPSATARTGDMVKDLAQGTTGRFWWVIAYESDALRWMNAGKKLEIYYLPRTTYANHPFCALNRVGASAGVAQGRASFEKFLRSDATQKQLLDDGFRPTEIGLQVKTRNNPFLNAEFRARGARLEGLPLEERSNLAATQNIAQEWGKRYG